MYHFLNDPCGNSTSSPELAEESSAECFSDIPASVLSRLSPTAERCFCSVSGMEFCLGFQSGTTSEPLTGLRGEEWWMSSAEGFHARTSALEETGRELMESEVDYGQRWAAPFAKFDQDLCLWKTAQPSLFEELGGFSGTWPRWGMMRDGECFHANRQAEFTYESESGFGLPTTGANEYKGSSRKRYIGSADFRGAKMSEGLRTCETDPIYLNPSFAELVMMWPVGWTDCTPLGTDKFQEWRRSHGKPYQPTPEL